MADLRGVPPGRAGRLWLSHRLETGQLAADLLDRKQRILRERHRRMTAHAEETGRRWRAAWQEAERWGRRGAVIGGRRELRLAAPAEAVRIEVEWTSVMGVRYPAGARCHLPDAGPDDRAPGTAALVTAAAAYRAAVIAAAEHAAAQAAADRMAAELVALRRRVRAITDRWLPTLQDALRERATRLSEEELAEAVRLRWAAGRAARGRVRADRDDPASGGRPGGRV